MQNMFYGVKVRLLQALYMWGLREWFLAGVAVYAGVLILQAGCVPRAVAEQPIVIQRLTREDGVVDLRSDGGPPVRRGIPPRPEGWQAVPPCDPEGGEVAINGACYIELSKKPPCGRTLEHGRHCYRPVAKVDRTPTSVEP